MDFRFCFRVAFFISTIFCSLMRLLFAYMQFDSYILRRNKNVYHLPVSGLVPVICLARIPRTLAITRCGEFEPLKMAPPNLDNRAESLLLVPSEEATVLVLYFQSIKEHKLFLSLGLSENCCTLKWNWFFCNYFFLRFFLRFFFSGYLGNL